jgi:hypothetical protein
MDINIKRTISYYNYSIQNFCCDEFKDAYINGIIHFYGDHFSFEFKKNISESIKYLAPGKLIYCWKCGQKLDISVI